MTGYGEVTRGLQQRRDPDLGRFSCRPPMVNSASPPPSACPSSSFRGLAISAMATRKYCCYVACYHWHAGQAAQDHRRSEAVVEPPRPLGVVTQRDRWEMRRSMILLPRDAAPDLDSDVPQSRSLYGRPHTIKHPVHDSLSRQRDAWLVGAISSRKQMSLPLV